MSIKHAVYSIYGKDYLHDFSEYRNHESLYEFVNEKISDVRLLIAVHNTKFGKCLGGVRAIPYPSRTEAIEDVLRLSYMMSIKAAFAGIDLGGAKAVLLCDKQMLQMNHYEIFRWVGECVNCLDGRYIAAQDMGVSYYDLTAMRETTQYMRGLKKYSDTDYDFVSSTTATGVMAAMQSAVKHKFGNDSESKNLVYLVQGCLGKVGFKVAAKLADLGKTMLVSDIKSQNQIAEAFKCVDIPEKLWHYVAPSDVYRAEYDVFMPCAVGGVINYETVPQFHKRCRVVVGSANNQLADEKSVEDLMRRGILYVPDFVVNAGGLIAAAFEDCSEAQIVNKVLRIKDRVASLLSFSEESNIAPHRVAEEIALLLLSTNRLR